MVFLWFSYGFPIRSTSFPLGHRWCFVVEDGWRAAGGPDDASLDHPGAVAAWSGAWAGKTIINHPFGNPKVVIYGWLYSSYTTNCIVIQLTI